MLLLLSAGRTVFFCVLMVTSACTSMPLANLWKRAEQKSVRQFRNRHHCLVLQLFFFFCFCSPWFPMIVSIFPRRFLSCVWFFACVGSLAIFSFYHHRPTLFVAVAVMCVPHCPPRWQMSCDGVTHCVDRTGTVVRVWSERRKDAKRWTRQRELHCVRSCALWHKTITKRLTSKWHARTG